MRSGLWLPLFDELAEPAEVARLAAVAEEAGELVPAKTDAEDETAAADPVQCRGFPCELHRPTAGKGGDHGAQHHVLSVELPPGADVAPYAEAGATLVDDGP
jgi:hypothetical protein